MSRFYLNLIFFKKREVKKFFGHFTKIDKLAFWVCLTFSITLLTASFILPPSGQIDPSVIGAVGELFGFATLAVVIKAIGKGSDITLQKGDVNVTLNNPDKGDEE